MVMASDREAICAGILTCHSREELAPGMILIRDTLHLTRFMVSENLVPLCQKIEAATMGLPRQPIVATLMSFVFNK